MYANATNGNTLPNAKAEIALPTEILFFLEVSSESLLAKTALLHARLETNVSVSMRLKNFFLHITKPQHC